MGGWSAFACSAFLRVARNGARLLVVWCGALCPGPVMRAVARNFLRKTEVAFVVVGWRVTDDGPVVPSDMGFRGCAAARNVRRLAGSSLRGFGVIGERDNVGMASRLTVLDEIAMFGPTDALGRAVEEYREANRELGEADERYVAAKDRGASQYALTELYQQRCGASYEKSQAWNRVEARRTDWANSYMQVRGVSRSTARRRAVAESEAMIYGSAETAAEVKRLRRY